jgi:putative glycosyltransferase (TIGR04372 family)
MILFIKRQIIEIYNGGRVVLFDKLIITYKILLNFICNLSLCIIFLPIIIFIRLISPFFIIRFGELITSRIGHLAANTELYLCEKDEEINIPKKPYFDIFYAKDSLNSNKYLLNKWKNLINIWPRLLINPLCILNNIIPYGNIHKIGNNLNSDRDILNLLDKYPAHINFTEDEEKFGKIFLEKIGIFNNTKFVCLLVRDSAYLNMHLKNINTRYHNYRDCNIENYILVSEELTKRGYFVIRMGVKVNSIFNTQNPMIIDYANNGMRTEFLDIYLGAKCDFCISTSSGWDAIPLIFRRPIIYAPIVPLGYFFTFSKRYSAITKHHYYINEKRELTFSEIFEMGYGFSLTSEEFTNKGIQLIENTQEEIRDLVIEFVDKSNNIWESETNDEYLQDLFWQQFPINAIDAAGSRLHGQIKAHFGTKFLRNNVNLLK